MSREAQAKAYHESCKQAMKLKPQPKGQKFDCGSRVHISANLGRSMTHFMSDCDATVVYVYDHMYGGGNVKSYCLDIDDYGTVSWYDEEQLTAIPGATGSAVP